MTRIAETRDIATCRAIRRTVFVEEQQVPEADEWDDRDEDAIHLLAWQDDRPIGTARLLTEATTGKIGRVAVLAEARGLGVGAALIRAGLDRFRKMPGIAQVKLGAQTHALGFYEKLGFQARGPVYDDAGIPHRDMYLSL
ncbi:GNAT family N-acetyltransferase [Paracoccus pacificus]|uniref:GNAT family N-acetyltransferase n=1 Tax=Paracoccus pacificus TaxID=1463598 RepID=A0ABW4RAK9_9RHOB